MKKLILNIWLIILITLINGCSVNNLDTPSSKPKIDETLPVVEAKSIKTISDISSIALEWKNITQSSKVYGYNIYRANLNKDGHKLKRIIKLKSKYASHYLDGNLQPNTRYLYAISTRGAKRVESIASESIIVRTKPRMKSVSLITSISKLPRQIKILWRPHPNKRIAKYIIERSTQGSSRFRKIKTIKQRLQVEYLDTGLMDNTQYSYRIKVVTFDGIKSLASEITTARTKALPTNVTNIKASTNLPKMIKISWDQPQKIKDIVSYKIYVSKREDDKYYDLIGTVLVGNKTIFTHNIEYDGVQRFYKITTTDKDRLESTKKVAPVIGRTLNTPALPVVTLAMIKDNMVVLNWEAGDKRTVAYNVFKTAKKNFISRKTKKILDITTARFEDKDITRGVTYDYRLEAIDKYGLRSEKTHAITLTIPKLENTKNASSASH